MSKLNPWFFLIAATVVFGVIVAGLVAWWAYRLPQSKVCDWAVDMLVKSPNLADVTRAGVIVHELDCGISGRVTLP